MIQRFKNLNTRHLKTYVLYGLPLLLIAFGWFRTVEQAVNIENNTIQTFQQAQLEIVRNAVDFAEYYIGVNLPAGASAEERNDLAQDVQRIVVSPIEIYSVGDSNLGDAWIYKENGGPVFDDSEDFDDAYQRENINIAQIFEARAEASGARHYEDMVEAIIAGEEGVGWYVWSADKDRASAPWWEFITRDTGIEIAAWTDVTNDDVFGDLSWIIGMSTMLPSIMQVTGAYTQINQSIITMAIATVVAVALLILLRRAEAEVKNLRKKVQELRIEIDEGKKEQQVSAIVESDDFQDLLSRAKAMKKRRAASSQQSEQR